MEENVTVNLVRNLNKHTVIGLVLITLIACAAFVMSLAIYFVWADTHARNEVSTLIRGFHLTKEGNEIPVPTRKQFGFWTPNKNTSPPFNTAGFEWERVKQDDKRPSEFEDYINSISLGWRRYEQIGKGSSRKKTGYWWILSVDPSFNYKAFILKYHSIWETKTNVYVEEYPNQSKYIEKSSNN